MRPLLWAVVPLYAGLGCAAPEEAAEAPAPSLEARIGARLDSLQATSAFYAKHLVTGEEIAIRADVPMNSASVIKLPVMVRAYRDAMRGALRLEERRTLTRDVYRRGSGLFQTFDDGVAPTWRDIITQMIITSDNTATDLLIARVGGVTRVNALSDSLGYAGVRLLATTGDLFRHVWVMADSANATMSDREVFERGFPSDSGAGARLFRLAQEQAYWLGSITARDISRLLEDLELGRLADSAHTAEMRRILLAQFYASRLPRRLQGEVAIGHKTGDIPPILGNDVGILYAPSGPIVIAVLTNANRGDFVELEATIGRITRDVFREWGGVR